MFDRVVTLAPYAFGRFGMRFDPALFFPVLATRFVPAVALVPPFYLLFRDLGPLDTAPAPIGVNVGVVTPFAVLTLTGRLDAVPADSEEAAVVDGASRPRVPWDVVVPTVWPGVRVTAVLCFIPTRNEFLFALILARDDALTLPAGIARFRTGRGDLWELVAAAAGILVSVPVFLLPAVVQRHFARGLMGEAVGQGARRDGRRGAPRRLQTLGLLRRREATARAANARTARRRCWPSRARRTSASPICGPNPARPSRPSTAWRSAP